MKTLCALGLGLVMMIAVGEATAGETFPRFLPPSFDKPATWREVSAAEYVPVPDRAAANNLGHLWGGPEAFARLGTYFRDTPEGQYAWNSLATVAADTVNRWDFAGGGFGNDRYAYRIGSLSSLAVVHAFTGEKLLGEFIRTHVLHIVDLPMEFWLHSELRGYNREKPLGMLETAQTSRTLALTLPAAADLFTPGERAAIDDALRTKGLAPCLNWLEKPSVNNFTAVISSGAYSAGKYLGDRDAMRVARERLKYYAENSIEDDGSYGEGLGYFTYPLGALFLAAMAMTPAERDEVFGAAPLRHSAKWVVYPYFYLTDDAGKPHPWRTHYGDNSYSGELNGTNAFLLSMLYRDGLPRWLREFFAPDKPDWYKQDWRLQLYGDGAGPELPPAQSPKDLGLPLVAAFAGGENFIRSSWDPNATVLSLYTAGATKTNYSHQHAERNSIVLGALGEYFIVSPGSASYRHPMHWSYDTTTRAANTVEIDGVNQLLTRSEDPKFPMLQRGRPKAESLLAVAGKAVDVVAGEAAGSYKAPMEQALRAVAYVRASGYFVVLDRLSPKDGPHRYAWRLHFNNRDGKAELSPDAEAPGRYRLLRPRADLAMDILPDAPSGFTVEDAFMHGTGRDYSPGGIHEGKPGSAIELTVAPNEPVAATGFLSVLQPLAKDAAPLPVSRDGATLRVGGDSFTLDGNVWTITAGGVTESFRLGELPTGAATGPTPDRPAPALTALPPKAVKGRLAVGGKTRLSGLNYTFSSVPSRLAGLELVTIPRGGMKKPGAGYSLTLGQPATAYLLVMDLGEPTIPEGWTLLKETITWRNEKARNVDRVYTKTFPAGVVEIPPHDGKDPKAERYGVPHSVAFALEP